MRGEKNNFIASQNGFFSDSREIPTILQLEGLHEGKRYEVRRPRNNGVVAALLVFVGGRVARRGELARRDGGVVENSAALNSPENLTRKIFKNAVQILRGKV